MYGYDLIFSLCPLSQGFNLHSLDLVFRRSPPPIAGDPPHPHDMASSKVALFSHLSNPSVINSILNQMKQPITAPMEHAAIGNNFLLDHSRSASDNTQHVRLIDPSDRQTHTSAAFLP